MLLRAVDWCCRFARPAQSVDDAVGQAVIDRMIGTAANMLDTYPPALLSVIYANELPKEAIKRVEAGWC